MEIHGRLIQLRSYLPDDFETIRYFRKGDKEWKHLDEPAANRKNDDVIDHDVDQLILDYSEYESGVPFSLVIADISTNALIGEVSRYDFSHDATVSIGLVIYSPEKWKRGIGTEVITLWENYLLVSLNIKRFVIETWTGNKAMIRIAERHNYRLVESIPFTASEVLLYSNLRYEKTT